MFGFAYKLKQFIIQFWAITIVLHQNLLSLLTFAAHKKKQ